MFLMADLGFGGGRGPAYTGPDDKDLPPGSGGSLPGQLTLTNVGLLRFEEPHTYHKGFTFKADRQSNVGALTEATPLSNSSVAAMELGTCWSEKAL